MCIPGTVSLTDVRERVTPTAHERRAKHFSLNKISELLVPKGRKKCNLIIHLYPGGLWGCIPARGVARGGKPFSHLWFFFSCHGMKDLQTFPLANRNLFDFLQFDVQLYKINQSSTVTATSTHPSVGFSCTEKIDKLVHKHFALFHQSIHGKNCVFTVLSARRTISTNHCHPQDYILCTIS